MAFLQPAEKPTVTRSAAPILSAPTRREIDWATAAGILAAAALIAIAIFLGGSPFAFIDIPSILIVIGGTFAITTVSFTLKDVANAQKLFAKALFRQVHDPVVTAKQLLRMSDVSRRAGRLALQSMAGEFRHDRTLQSAAIMLSDGSSDREIEATISSEANAVVQRHLRSASVLRRAAEVAPAMGLIGTLIGLVQMLSQLDDPSSIGPAMAVALLTTFYGAMLSTMVLAPIATKLEGNSEQEALSRRLILVGAVSISRGENPRRLEMLLNSILPPANRLNIFD
jgi:chemotaxis protein MotA